MIVKSCRGYEEFPFRLNGQKRSLWRKGIWVEIGMVGGIQLFDNMGKSAQWERDNQHCPWSRRWSWGQKGSHDNWTIASRGESCVTWQMPSHKESCLAVRSQREKHWMARELMESDLWFENYCGFYCWWIVATRTKAGVSGGQLKWQIMVARTMEEAVEIERRDGAVGACQ